MTHSGAATVRFEGHCHRHSGNLQANTQLAQEAQAARCSVGRVRRTSPADRLEVLAHRPPLPHHPFSTAAAFHYLFAIYPPAATQPVVGRIRRL